MQVMTKPTNGALKKIQEPTSKLETITVEVAKVYLESMDGNRKVTQSNVDYISSEIRRGQWTLNGEAIKFDWNGVMFDGQHRCLAVIATGTPILSYVARGLDPIAFKRVDVGRKRTASDILSIEGFLYPDRIASMVKFIRTFENKSYADAAKSGTGRRKNITNYSDISLYAEKNKEALLNSLKYGVTKENKLISPIIIASLHFICNKIDEAQADEFFHKLIHPHDLGKESPIYILNRKLIENYRSKKKVDRLQLVALICRAWNYYRKNKRVTKIQLWDSVKEPFPRPE